MTPRDRVLAALNHQEADRVPIDLGSSIVTSITKAAYVPLRTHLGLPPEDVMVHDEVQQLPHVGEEVLARFGVDTRMVQLPPAHVAGVRAETRDAHQAGVGIVAASLDMVLLAADGVSGFGCA